MSLSAHRTRLAMATQDLSNQWKDTKERWRDVKSLEFEQKYLEELMAGVETAIEVIEQLDKLLTRIRNDCE